MLVPARVLLVLCAIAVAPVKGNWFVAAVDWLAKAFNLSGAFDYVEKKVCSPDGCMKGFYRWIDTWIDPFSLTPQDKKTVNTTFWLYKYSNSLREDPTQLFISDNTSLKSSGFNDSAITRIIIHGFQSGLGVASWVVEMVHALLKKEPSENVLVVDWKNGAKSMFTRAVANTPLVALQLAALLKVIKECYPKFDFDKVHIIGHSLGAHIAAFTAAHFKQNQKFGRITGLDPAAPFFRGNELANVLDPNSAKLVDVIHTSDSTTIAGVVIDVGTSSSQGHLDFRPNDQTGQPGCSWLEKAIKALRDLDIMWLFTCSHQAAALLFVESIKSELSAFLAHNCFSMLEYITGRCDKCTVQECAPMGYYANTYKNGELGDKERLQFYLTTGPSHTSLFHFVVAILLGKVIYPWYWQAAQAALRSGIVRITLVTEDDETHVVALEETGSDFVNMMHGQTVQLLMSSPKDLPSNVTKAQLYWKDSKCLLGLCFSTLSVLGLKIGTYDHTSGPGINIEFVPLKGTANELKSDSTVDFVVSAAKVPTSKPEVKLPSNKTESSVPTKV